MGIDKYDYWDQQIMEKIKQSQTFRNYPLHFTTHIIS